MLNYAEWKDIALLIKERSSEMFTEAQLDGNYPPFSIEATDADGNIIATLLLDSDERGEITPIELKPTPPDFSRLPIFLTLRTMKGTIRRNIA